LRFTRKTLHVVIHALTKIQGVSLETQMVSREVYEAVRVRTQALTGELGEDKENKQEIHPFTLETEASLGTLDQQVHVVAAVVAAEEKRAVMAEERNPRLTPSIIQKGHSSELYS
jgi:hypothetical protein